MPMTGDPFDWRGFWADLLQGAGRGLLEFDGSDAARAAMSGLDYFDASRRRRAERQEAQPEDEHLEAPFDSQAELAEELALATQAMQGGHADTPSCPRCARASELHQGPLIDPRLHGRTPPAPGHGLSPSMRRAPLSANPYDLPGLPFQVNFSSSGLPVLRRG